jgi:hypothetical protein
MLVLFPRTRSFCFAPPRKYFTASEKPDPWGPAGTEANATKWADTAQDVFTSFAAPGAAKSTPKAAKQVQEEVNGVLVKDMERQKGEELNEGDMDKKEAAMELYGKPFMKIVGGLADKWERFAKWVMSPMCIGATNEIPVPCRPLHRSCWSRTALQYSATSSHHC